MLTTPVQFPPVSNRVKERTCWNILPVDVDVFVPVAPCVLMIETQRMVQLVLNGTVVNTTISGQRHYLLATRSPQIGITAERK